MNKKQFAVIGSPIGHTISPFINQRMFDIAKVSADYEAYDVSTYDLTTIFPSLCKLDGYNVTLPHKYAIVPYLDELSKKALKYRSVNTIMNKDGKSFGYTTDPAGFLKSLEYEKIDLKGRVVIIGAGGVARILAYESVLAGCATVIAARPTGLKNAANLAGDIKSNTIRPQIETCLIDHLKGPIDLLINATPCGMYPKTDEMAVSDEIVKSSSVVFDCIYNPYRTKLLNVAKSYGIKTISGLPMLVLQAAEAHKIWTGAEFSQDDISQIIEDSRKEMKHVFGK